ncbi:MAG: replicase [Corpardiv virus 3]|nr:MAG: replicase [Corpardiv virus 3]
MEYPPFDYHFFMVSEQETLSAMLDKGETALTKANAKNDPNANPDKVSAFLKGQFISKLGTIYRNAKKGQMITECHQYLNRLFGPTIRYIYNCVRSNIGPEILILKGMTDEDVEQWFADYWQFSNVNLAPPTGTINADAARALHLNTYEDDYTGFDSTQNEEFLAFQCLLMNALQIPQYIIDLFIWHHTHLYSFLGEMNVMIPSGAMHTYDFNTLDSMAYFALKHRITPHLPLSMRDNYITVAAPSHPCDGHHYSPAAPGYTTTVALAFSGDDTLANEIVEVHPGFFKLPHSFSLQSSGTHTFIPHFVGKLHTPGGSFSDPTLLLAKLLYRIAKETISQSALSYASHCYQLHRNYYRCQSYLTSQEKLCHATNLAILRLLLKRYGYSLIGSHFQNNIRMSFSL